eukprot:2394960-Prymnesium_polylepis.1
MAAHTRDAASRCNATSPVANGERWRSVGARAVEAKKRSSVSRSASSASTSHVDMVELVARASQRRSSS